MKKPIIKLEKISLHHFKNVCCGEVVINSSKNTKSNNVLGIYGQNGSGKTALIDAIALAKSLICGSSVDADYINYIHVDAKYAALQFTFSIDCEYGHIVLTYDFELSKQEKMVKTNNIYEKVIVPLIQNEKLHFSLRKNDEIVCREQMLIDTSNEQVFGPMAKYEELIGKNADTKINLLVAKKMALSSGSSFVFSNEMINSIKQNCSNVMFWEILDAMNQYAMSYLYVIRSSSSDSSYAHSLPLSFSVMYKNEKYYGNMPLPLDKSFPIDANTEIIVKKVMSSTNIVLTQLVPGLEIAVKELGKELNKNGEETTIIQIVSKKNKKEIPLRYESDGIKKIISVLELLIVMYNKPYYTIAIDELDAGIFEYLLGELLHIISEHGKGQLIFTSHNLRPLETLDKSNILFTTTNPENRYIRLTNVKTTNNLRDLYYRDIILGEKCEELYESTNNYEIELALRQAGEYIDA